MLIVLCLYLLGSLSGVLRGTHGAASPRRCKIPDSDPTPNPFLFPYGKSIQAQHSADQIPAFPYFCLICFPNID
uniref:Putative secreted protein n=1 Tax=Anopheles marajoara TaxID=58244 RepID=A0A2M4CDE1_9DIPT